MAKTKTKKHKHQGYNPQRPLMRSMQFRCRRALAAFPLETRSHWNISHFCAGFRGVSMQNGSTNYPLPFSVKLDEFILSPLP